MQRRIASGVVVGLLAMGITACGSSSSSDTSAASSSSASSTAAPGGAFDAAVAKASAPISNWTGPTGAPKPAAKKKIVVVTCSSQGNGCVRAAQGVTDAGRKLGWSVQTIDGQGNPQAWNGGINTAISEKADGIVLDAVPPALVGDALVKAKAAKIPVVSIFNPDLGKSSPVFSYVTPDHTAQGKVMADWVAAESKGKAQIVLIEDNEFPELVQRVDGFKAELAKCSGCKVVDTVQSQIGTMAQKLPGAVASSLQSHPTANYVISPFDSNATFTGQGVRQAGKQGTVKVAGYEGDSQAVDAIRKGQIQAMTVADPAEWMGWQAVDEFNRAFSGQKAQNTPVQWRVLTKSNVPATGNWTGDFDYRGQYGQLWGR
jgi:ribose transport system substrate-binding protein